MHNNTSCIELAHSAHCSTLDDDTAHLMAQVLSNHIVISIPSMARSLWFDLSLLPLLFLPALLRLLPLPRAVSLSSTYRSSWQVCATPLQMRVRTPWTPSPLTQETPQEQNLRPAALHTTGQCESRETSLHTNIPISRAHWIMRNGTWLQRHGRRSSHPRLEFRYARELRPPGRCWFGNRDESTLRDLNQHRLVFRLALANSRVRCKISANFILALRQFSRRENSAKPSTWGRVATPSAASRPRCPRQVWQAAGRTNVWTDALGMCS